MAPPPERPGSDGLPNAWLFERLNRLEDLTREQHQRLRTDMQGGFDLIRSEFFKHEEFDQETRQRVIVLETKREADQQSVQRRSSIYGVIAGAAVSTIIAALKKAFGG